MTKKNRKRSAGIVLRDILLALLLVAVVAASAILVYRRFFESGPATPDEKRNIAMNHYDADSFYEENGMLRYAKSAHLTGVDVSEHQEKIDWAAVRAAGVDFAILRIGYRGYTEGSLREDSWFAENYTAARAAGVQLGVYFFSQATTLEEAREEADYTLELLDGRTLELPVFYDWETVAGSTRIPSPDGLPLTQCAAAFCQTVEAAGYTTRRMDIHTLIWAICRIMFSGLRSTARRRNFFITSTACNIPAPGWSMALPATWISICF